MLGKIAELDRKISRPVIEADATLVSFVLYPFAAFFHPKLIWVAYLAVYFFSGRDLHATVVFLLGSGFCLLTTFILKKSCKRFVFGY